MSEPEDKSQVEEVKPETPEEEEDFLAGVQACDLSGEGTCESCQ